MAKFDGWIHSFTVTDTITHKKGYTLYKITSVVFPIQIPEALTCLTIWKRFTDIKRLYKEICRRHRELHLRGIVPQINIDNYFRRFDQKVIEERKDFILKLLDFIAQSPALYKSHAFINFFEGSHSPLNPSSPTTLRPHPLKIEVNKPTTDSSNIEKICNEISVSYDQQQDITLIDPTKDSTDDQQIDTGLNFQQIISCDSSLKTDTNSNSSNTDDSMLVSAMIELGEQQELLQNDDEIDQIDSSDGLAILSDNEKINVNDDSLFNFNYIYEAALEFSNAVQEEVLQNYQLSFEKYKNGIDILLNGVKCDVNEERKVIAKQKVKKYLERAEEIYENFLINNSETNDSQIITTNPYQHVQASTSLSSLTSTPNEIMLSIERPINQLSKYKVIKIFDSVMQVQDITNKKIFIMKAIQKSSSVTSLPHLIFLPQNIPFMVQLLSYFQSDNTIYLLLQQASGGKLWDYINSYESPKFCINQSSNQEQSLAELFTEPKIKSDKINTGDGNKKTLEINESFFSGDSGYEETISTTDKKTDEDQSLKSYEKELENNLQVPSFELLSHEMDVLDLVNCSQKLLQSVSNTLDQLKDQKSFDLTEEILIKEEQNLISIIDNVKSFDESFKTISADNKINSVFETKELLNVRQLPDGIIKQWTSQLVTAITILHAQNVICYDLHSDNLLLGASGDLLLSYFYRCADENNITIDNKLNLKSLQNLYVAPERPLRKESDWWSFGVIFFELITGYTFLSCHPGGILSYYEIQYPPDINLSIDVIDLLNGLLQVNPEERYNGTTIRNHKYFETVNWDKMMEQYVNNIKIWLP